MAICEFIDKDKTEIINFKIFSSIPFKEITSKVFDKRWFVHKWDFLFGILAESECKKLEDYSKLLQIFDKFDDNGDGVLTLDEFTELIKTLEPEKDDFFVVRMFRKALELEMDIDNVDKMSPDAFC